MKKIVIAAMLVVLMSALVASTVFAKEQPMNPKANENACFGQSVRNQGATTGSQGETAREVAHNENTPGAAADIHFLRCYWNCSPCEPQCE